LIFDLFLNYVNIYPFTIPISMEKIGGHLINQRLRRQLVYPFSEIDYQPLNDRFERKLEEDDTVVEVIERAEDEYLLPIQNVSDGGISPLEKPKNTTNELR
jgi:hypothetical protein